MGTFNHYVITKYPKFGSPLPLVCTSSNLVATVFPRTFKT